MINKNKAFIAPFLFSLLFLLLIFFFCYTDIVPFSDSLQYMELVLSHGPDSFWPWLDRICLAVTLKIFSFLPIGTIYVAPLFMISTNTMIAFFLTRYCYRKYGVIGFYLSSALMISSYYALAYSTYLYPESLGILFSLMAFCILFDGLKNQKKIFLSAIFCSFACLTKITFIPVLLVLAIYLFLKNRRDLVPFVIGVISGSLFLLVLFGLLFGYDSLLNTIASFGNDLSKNIINKDRPNNLVPWFYLLFNINLLPLYISIFFLKDIYNKENIVSTMIAFGFICGILFIYSFGQRGGWIIPHYMSPSAPFLIISLTSSLSSLYKEHVDFSLKNIFIIFVVFVLSLIFYNQMSKVFFIVPVLSFYVFYMIQKRIRSMDFWLLFYLLILFVLPLNLSSARSYLEPGKFDAHKMTINSRILAQIEDNDYYIYVSKWNKADPRYGEKIIQYYNVLFKEDARALEKERYIGSEQQFEKIKHDKEYYVLTDIQQLNKNRCVVVNSFIDYDGELYYLKCANRFN